MLNLSHNQSTMKKQNFRHIAVTVTLSNIDSSHLTSSIYNDNNDFNQNNDDHGRQYRIVICFRHHGSLRGFVCELFPITKINQDFLLTIKCKILKFF